MPLTLLEARLDALQAALPGLLADYPDPGDFWPAFAGEADFVEDVAGEHAAYVTQRINAMLASAGAAHCS